MTPVAIRATITLLISLANSISTRNEIELRVSGKCGAGGSSGLSTTSEHDHTVVTITVKCSGVVGCSTHRSSQLERVGQVGHGIISGVDGDVLERNIESG